MTARRSTPPTRRAIVGTLVGAVTLLVAGCGTTSNDEVSVLTTADRPPTSSRAADTSTDNGNTSTDGADTSTDPDGRPTSITGSPDLDAVAIDLVEIGTFDRPVNLAVRPGDTALYVVGQSGTIIRHSLDGTSATGSGSDAVGTIAADLSDMTVAEGERGLLGLAFSPSGDRAYVDYTDLAGDTVVAEYRVDADGVFDLGSRRVLLEIAQPYGNHNGGHLVVDPEGRLLIGMGDGGAGGDPERRSLDPDDLLGKILRIDPQPDEETGLPYGIPPDNPHADGVGGRREVLLSGVRNPWKFTFDAATGDLWVADVGQNGTEEATRVPASAIAGASLGWSAYEGDQRYNDDQPAEGHLPPSLTYRHGDLGCSISGGAVYRGEAIGELIGAYVFGDFCSGRVVALDPTSGRSIELARVSPVSAVLPGPDGELYVASYEGEVWRIDERS